MQLKYTHTMPGAQCAPTVAAADLEAAEGGSSDTTVLFSVTSGSPGVLRTTRFTSSSTTAKMYPFP